MALKNQPQESAAAPEQAAQTEQQDQTAAPAPAQTETVTDAGSGTPAAPTAEEIAAAALVTDKPAEDDTKKASQETQDETDQQVSVKDQEASDTPLLLLGSRKGFPQTAAGNFNLISDVVTELYNKGALVISGEGEESSVFFDMGKL